MSTKLLLSSLAITGVLVGAKAANAWVSVSKLQNVATNSTATRSESNGTSAANAILTDDDTFSAENHPSAIGNKISNIQPHSAKIAWQSEPNTSRQNVSTISSVVPNHQVDVFAGDVAILGSRTQAQTSNIAEDEIEIPVPAPRTRSLQPVAPVSRLPQLTNRPTVAQSNSTQSEVAIEIPVPAPRTQSIDTVAPVAQLPSVTQTIPVVTAIPTVEPSSTSGEQNPSMDLSQVAIYPFSHPVPVTSPFGWRTHPLTGNRRFHAGVDLGAAMGTPVMATISGTIVSAGWKGGYGKAVVIEHNGIYQTLYGHLSAINVSAGQQIERGTVIGLVGSTGNSTGPHLHFEERISTNGSWVAVNPIDEIKYALENLNRTDPFAQREVPPGL